MVNITKDQLAVLNAGSPATTMAKKPRKRNKYGAKKIVIDGIPFHSIKEGRRYQELKLQEHCGFISRLELQPEFLLKEKFRHDRTGYKPIKYFGDFKYVRDGKEIVEDVKSDITRKNPVYRIKKKLLLSRYPEINFIET